MTELTKETFKTEVLDSSVPVLVDFWAPWCGPCLMQAPVLESLAKEMEGKPVKIVKVNVDENQEIAMNYHIVSIPTLAIFNKGNIVETMVGVHSKDTLTEKLTKYL